jgi:serine/threonine-protein kinase
MTELPTSFGKYYLTEKLATGGMAEIYLAKIIGPGGFEKPVVIKQILPKLSGQRHFVDLFVAEAKTLVTLTHGNIVPVYELGVIDDTYFIAMDYIDGPTLYRLTETMARRDAQMRPAVAAWITARMLEGLDYAHRKGEGVIHRDLSPRNVMLSRDGDVKLVDFGIAVTLGEPGEDSSTHSAPTGSFPYMSPEQVRRDPLTVQTDLFSAGVLMWEMLTGRRLFAKSDAEATLAAVLDGDIPRPSSVRPEVPAKLDEVVMRALERDRTKRWESAADMLAPLNKYLYSLDETPGPRDVAALVARFCPPETRRLPTNAEADQLDAPSPNAPSTTVDKPAASGPSTAVIPRDQQARGRPKRQQTFATNVEIKSILDNATPLLAFDAITDPPEQEAPPVDDAPKPVEVVKERLRQPPSRFALVLAGVGGLGLGIGAIIVFFANRDRVLHNDIDAGVKRDAPAYMSRFDDAYIDDILDAPAQSSPPIDAGAVDAAPVVTHDARKIEPRIDAAVTQAPKGSATLKVGADPWGDIYVDGKSMGRTPRELTVAPGHHAVEVVFPAENPPRKQTFSVDLANGETKALQADFAH